MFPKKNLTRNGLHMLKGERLTWKFLTETNKSAFDTWNSAVGELSHFCIKDEEKVLSVCETKKANGN